MNLAELQDTYGLSLPFLLGAVAFAGLGPTLLLIMYGNRESISFRAIQWQIAFFILLMMAAGLFLDRKLAALPPETNPPPGCADRAETLPVIFCTMHDLQRLAGK